MTKRTATEDPNEHGILKALNWRLNSGQAFESLSFAKKPPLLHGHAVAAVLVCELYLSHKCCDLSVETLRKVTNFMKANYPPFAFGCNDYDTLYELMTHDKKNEGGHIRFALLHAIGDIRINQEITKDLILASLDFYRENMGLA